MSTPRNLQINISGSSGKKSKTRSYSSYGRDSQILAYSPASNEYFTLFNSKFVSDAGASTKVEDNNQSHSCSPQQPSQEDEAKSPLVFGM